MRAARFAFATVLTLLATGLGAASCAGSDSINTGGGGNGTGAGQGTGAGSGTGAGHGTGANGPIPTEICLLHNCSSDVECAACSNGKTTCLVEEHRCVACNSGSTGGCPSGQQCSSWGNCVEESAPECTTDNGVPTITCNENKDCAGCDPRHQICDPAAHKCVACTGNDTTECQSTETCNGGDCVPKCPSTCESDGDCSECGGPGAEAHACNNNRCSTCSPTIGCDGSSSCGEHGTCEEPCGTVGAPKGECATDADCMGCDGSATKCHVPIGGGKGKCGPSATGCSDLGEGVAVLPDPFDKVTNLCSNDSDCASVGIELNVGKILRDLTGWDQIHDANLSYPMHACASVQILDDKSCGVCVPCKVDSDCQNLNIDQIAGDAFGPLGAIASAFLLDQIFGDEDHQIHMYCETVVGEYGVCVPCPGLLNDCSVGGGTEPEPCHNKCDAGAPLDPVSCGDPCVAAVCAMDAYCCDSKWDHLCVSEVLDYCGKACESCHHEDKGGHDKCEAGGPLATDCSDCVASICGDAEHPAVRPECCGENGGSWDQECINLIPQYCEEPYWCSNQCHYALDCPDGQGCSLETFTCGQCTSTAECWNGEVCNNGSCVPE